MEGYLSIQSFFFHYLIVWKFLMTEFSFFMLITVEIFKPDQASFHFKGLTCVSISCLDRGCIYGIQPDPAVHIFPLGCFEEQQAFRGTAADSSAGDEPHACSTGGIHFNFKKEGSQWWKQKFKFLLSVSCHGCRLLMLSLVTKCSLTMIEHTSPSCVRKLDSCRGHWSTTLTCMTLSVLWCTHTS